MEGGSGDFGAESRPVLACVRTVSEAVKHAAGASPVFMTPEQKQLALTALYHAESQLAGLRLSVLAASGDVATQHGNRHVATWLAPAARLDPGPVHADERLAKSLDTRWQLVATGLLEGEVNLAQAKVVVRALDRLKEPLPPDPARPGRGPEPRRIPAEILGQAEVALVAAAEDHTPRELAVLGDRILHIVAGRWSAGARPTRPTARPPLLLAPPTSPRRPLPLQPPAKR